MVKSSLKWEGELQGAEAKMAMQDVAERSSKVLNDGAAGMRAVEDNPAMQIPGTPRGLPSVPGAETPRGNRKPQQTEEGKAAERAARIRHARRPWRPMCGGGGGGREDALVTGSRGRFLGVGERATGDVHFGRWKELGGVREGQAGSRSRQEGPAS